MCPWRVWCREPVSCSAGELEAVGDVHDIITFEIERAILGVFSIEWFIRYSWATCKTMGNE